MAVEEAEAEAGASVEEIWLILDALGRVKGFGTSREDAEGAFEGMKNQLARECEYLRVDYAASILGPFKRSPDAMTHPMTFRW